MECGCCYICEYLREFKFSFVALTREDLDIENTTIKCLEKCLHSIIFSPLSHAENNTLFVLNACGLIPQRSDTSLSKFLQINMYFPHMLQQLSSKFRYQLIHISTDCVFDGKQINLPYNESDPCTENAEFYGISKRFGDLLLQNTSACIFRTSIIGEDNKGLSLMQWLISNRGKAVNGFTNHYWNGVTCLQLVKIIIETIVEDVLPVGKLQHVYTAGNISKYQLLGIINNIYDLRCTITPVKHQNTSFKCLNSETKDEKLCKILHSIPSYEAQIKELHDFRGQIKKNLTV